MRKSLTSIAEARTWKVRDRVVVFDDILYKDDIRTPLSVTMKPAMIVAIRVPGDVYGELLIDVLFDHRKKEISHGHFSSFIEKMEG